MLHQVSGAGGLGVVELVLGTGPVVAAVLWMLVAFSVGRWGIILYKLVQISRARRESERFIAMFWESKNLAAIHSASIDLKRSPVAQVFRAGYQELLQLTRAKRQVVGAGRQFLNRSGRGRERDARHEAPGQCRADQTRVGDHVSGHHRLDLPVHRAVRHGVGNHDGVSGLSAAHSSNIQAVAPGIAEALITTAVGLVAAIPAQMLYNFFTARVRVLATEMDNFTSEFVNIAERHFLS